MADKLTFKMPDAPSPAPPIGANVGESLVMSVPLAQIQTFPNHPFRVQMNEDMQELVESVQDHGIQEPVTLRAMGGYYQLLSGHRRCKAAKLAGLTEVPAIVKHDMDDYTATVWMVQANRRRSHIAPSELAKAYAMEMDALRHQGKKADGAAAESWSANQIAKDSGVSSRQVYRYIRLAKLIDPLLAMVDNSAEKVKANPSKQIFVMPMAVALTLADLPQKQQQLLYNCICQTGKAPTLSQAAELYKMNEQNGMTLETISAVLNEVEKKKAAACPFSSDFIDAVLLSWYEDSLAAHYRTDTTQKFTKRVLRTYRHQGYTGPIAEVQTHIDGKSDGLYIYAQHKSHRLTWTKVAVRIGELIGLGRYQDPFQKPKEQPAPPAEATLCDTVAQSAQPAANLRQLRNKQERESFLENYACWGVWKEIPELRVRFYKYDLPNGARIVAQTYVHPPIPHIPDRNQEYTVAEYALLLPEGDDFRGQYEYGQEHTFYRPNGASKSTLIAYLAEKKPWVANFD